MRGMSVILILILLVNLVQSGSGIAGSEFEERDGADHGAEEEGGDEGRPPVHYEDAETCPCTSYAPNMKTVVVKSTWCLELIS